MRLSVTLLAFAAMAALVVPDVAVGQAVADARAGARGEPWLGQDKVKHFFMAGFVESMGFGALQAAGANRGAAFAGAIAITAAAAVGREIHDRRTKGVFSPSDLAWGTAGAVAALLILTRTQR